MAQDQLVAQLFSAWISSSLLQVHPQIDACNMQFYMYQLFLFYIFTLNAYGIFDYTLAFHYLLSSDKRDMCRRMYYFSLTLYAYGIAHYSPVLVEYLLSRMRGKIDYA